MSKQFDDIFQLINEDYLQQEQISYGSSLKDQHVFNDSKQSSVNLKNNDTKSQANQSLAPEKNEFEANFDESSALGQPTNLDQLISNLGQQINTITPNVSKQPSQQSINQQNSTSQGLNRNDKILNQKKDIWESVNDLQNNIADLDIMEAQRQVPNVRRGYEERSLKLLVLGRSGIGKSTFIKNLLLSYTQDVNFSPKDAGQLKWEKFDSEFRNYVTEVFVNDDTNLVKYNFYVQDTPGLNNDDQSKLEQISNFIMQQSYDKYKKDIELNKDDPDQWINAFDLCIYILPPHQATEFDIEAIKVLSKVVSTIPIISKADSLNPEELQQQKSMVNNKLYSSLLNESPTSQMAFSSNLYDDSNKQARKGVKQDENQQGINLDCLNQARSKDLSQGKELDGSYGNDQSQVFQFSDDTLERAQISNEFALPLAIVCSNVLDSEIPFWPIRKYRWGQCCAFREEDSDLKFLRRLIFEQGYWQIKETGQRMYKDFCSKVHEDILPTILEKSRDKFQGLVLRNNSFHGNEIKNPTQDNWTNVQDKITQNTLQKSELNKVDYSSAIGEIEQQNEQLEPLYQEVPNNDDTNSSIWSSSQDDNVENEQYDFFDRDSFVEATVADITKRDTKYSITLNLMTFPSKTIKVQVGNNEGLSMCNHLNYVNLNQKSSNRPSIYDVTAKIFQDMASRNQGSISRISIDSLQNSVFYCSIWQSYGGVNQEKSFDARPSDGLNLALRLDCPIYISKHLVQIQGL